MSGFIKYKTYAFIDKDPVIDQVRTVVQGFGETHAQISRASGVSSGTLHNWFAGPTKRPQFATINAVLRACNSELVIVKRRQKR